MQFKRQFDGGHSIIKVPRQDRVNVGKKVLFPFFSASNQVREKDRFIHQSRGRAPPASLSPADLKGGLKVPRLPACPQS